MAETHTTKLYVRRGWRDGEKILAAITDSDLDDDVTLDTVWEGDDGYVDSVIEVTAQWPEPVAQDEAGIDASVTLPNPAAAVTERLPPLEASVSAI